MLQELVACVVVSLTSSAILAGGILGVGVLLGEIDMGGMEMVVGFLNFAGAMFAMCVAVMLWRRFMAAVDRYIEWGRED